MMNVRIGTRGSKLALVQAQWVKEKIEALIDHTRCEVVVLKTRGDKLVRGALYEQAGKGFFTKEIEEALIEDRVDLAVHSAKDLPTEIPRGLVVGAVPEREVSNDVLISKGCRSLKDLPQGARVGTSSLRRKSQLLLYRKELRIIDMRGNLDTRMKKLHGTDLDGIIVAYAGVKRLHFEHAISEVIPHNILLPAAGQGAVAIEVRKDDHYLRRMLEKLNHRESWLSVMAERSFLRKLHGGCQVPVGAYAHLAYHDVLVLEGVISNIDGTRVIRRRVQGNAEDTEGIGNLLADEILRLGGSEIVEELREWRANRHG